MATYTGDPYAYYGMDPTYAGGGNYYAQTAAPGYGYNAGDPGAFQADPYAALTRVQSDPLMAALYSSQFGGANPADALAPYMRDELNPNGPGTTSVFNPEAYRSAMSAGEARSPQIDALLGLSSQTPQDLHTAAMQSLQYQNKLPGNLGYTSGRDQWMMHPEYMGDQSNGLGYLDPANYQAQTDYHFNAPGVKLGQILPAIAGQIMMGAGPLMSTLGATGAATAALSEGAGAAALPTLADASGAIGVPVNAAGSAIGPGLNAVDLASYLSNAGVIGGGAGAAGAAGPGLGNSDKLGMLNQAWSMGKNFLTAGTPDVLPEAGGASPQALGGAGPVAGAGGAQGLTPQQISALTAMQSEAHQGLAPRFENRMAGKPDSGGISTFGLQ